MRRSILMAIVFTTLLVFLVGRGYCSVAEVTGTDVNATDAEGVTALMYSAARNESPEVISALIEAGAHVNVGNEDGVTPLMCAAYCNINAEVIRVFINSGTDVNVKDRNGMAALIHTAGWNEDPEVIDVLLDAGADASLKDDFGKTAFDYATENENVRGTATYWRLLMLG